MSGENNRGRRPTTGGSLVLTAALAAAGALAGAAAVDHMQAQQENRPSAVENIFRWFTEDVLGSAETGGGHGAGPSRRRARRLSRADVAALPTRVYGANGGGIAGSAAATATESGPSHERDEKCFCAICQESFSARDQVMRLPCFHEYHTDCIVDALTASEFPRCPICRHPVIL